MNRILLGASLFSILPTPKLPAPLDRPPFSASDRAPASVSADDGLPALCELRQQKLVRPLANAPENSLREVLRSLAREKKPQVIFVGDAHGTFGAHATFRNILKETREIFDANCLFLESPDLKSARLNDHADIIGFARRLGMKTLPVDGPSGKSVQERTDAMAKNIEANFDNGGCKVAVMIIGENHLSREIPYTTGVRPIQSQIGRPAVVLSYVSMQYEMPENPRQHLRDPNRGDLVWPSCSGESFDQLPMGIRAVSTSAMNFKRYSPDAQDLGAGTLRWNEFDALVTYR